MLFSAHPTRGGPLKWLLVQPTTFSTLLPRFWEETWKLHCLGTWLCRMEWVQVDRRAKHERLCGIDSAIFEIVYSFG